MEFTSIGSERNRKTETHVASGSKPKIVGFGLDDGAVVRLTIKTDRRYTQYLTAVEVVECFLRLPADKIAEAVCHVCDELPQLLKVIPDVQKQLSVGAISASKDLAKIGQLTARRV